MIETAAGMASAVVGKLAGKAAEVGRIAKVVDIAVWDMFVAIGKYFAVDKVGIAFVAAEVEIEIANTHFFLRFLAVSDTSCWNSRNSCWNLAGIFSYLVDWQ